MNENDAESAPKAESTPPGPPATSKKVGPRTRRPYRARRYAAGFLVVLFSISLFASVVSFWGARQVLNPNASCRTLRRPFRTRTFKRRSPTTSPPRSSRSSTRRRRSRASSPPKAKVIVGPVVLAFQNLVHSAVQKLVASPRFQKVLLGRDPSCPCGGHRAARGQDEGQSRHRRQRGGAEHPPARRLQHSDARAAERAFPSPSARAAWQPRTATPSQQLEQLSHSLGVVLPPNFGRMVVFRSNTLQQAQSGLKKLPVEL